MNSSVVMLMALGLGIDSRNAAAETIDAATYPRAAAAISAQRLATDFQAATEPARLLLAALAGARADLLATRAQAHVLFAHDAVGPAVTAWQRVDALASRIGEHEVQREALRHRAELSLLLGEYADCQDFAAKLLALAETVGDASQAAIAQGYLGIVARRQGDLDAAYQLHMAALERLRTGNDEATRALTMTNLGTVLRDRGAFAEALEMQLQALQIRERSGHQLETSYRNVALLYREIEDEQTARSYFVRALDAAARHFHSETYAPVLGSFASLLNDIGDHAPALAAAEEALLIDTALGNRASEAFERIEVGRAMIGLGRADEGESLLETALSIGRENGHGEIIAKALLHLAESAQGMRDNLRARGLIDEAIARLETTRFRPQLVQAYALRERIAVAQHDPVGALRYAHLLAKQRELLLGTTASRRLSALEARLARAQSSQQIALLQKDNELQAANLRAQGQRQRLSIAAMSGLALALGMAIWAVARMRRLNHALTGRNARILAQQDALESANAMLSERADALYVAAISDPLTGVFNRTHLRERLVQRLAGRSGAHDDPAVLMIDFDHFKKVNDGHGHLHGDRVLMAGIAAMRECIGPDDLIGRFGGEEFVIVLLGHSAESAHALAERLRRHVQTALRALGLDPLELTVSIGIALRSQTKRLRRRGRTLWSRSTRSPRRNASARYRCTVATTSRCARRSASNRRRPEKGGCCNDDIRSRSAIAR